VAPDPKPDPFADLPGPRDPSLPQTQVLVAPEEDAPDDEPARPLGDTPDGLDFEDATTPTKAPADDATLDEPDVPEDDGDDLSGVPSPEDWDDESSTVVDPVPPQSDD